MEKTTFLRARLRIAKVSLILRQAQDDRGKATDSFPSFPNEVWKRGETALALLGRGRGDDQLLDVRNGSIRSIDKF
jgi:hypothetical protein